VRNEEDMSKKSNKEVIEISRNAQTRQVVEITTIPNKKNRKGLPYKESRTRHLSVNTNKGGKKNAKQDSKDS